MATKAALQTKVDDLTELLEQLLECFSPDNTTFEATANQESIDVSEECERLLNKIDISLYCEELTPVANDLYYEEDD